MGLNLQEDSDTFHVRDPDGLNVRVGDRGLGLSSGIVENGFKMKWPFADAEGFFRDLAHRNISRCARNVLRGQSVDARMTDGEETPTGLREKAKRYRLLAEHVLDRQALDVLLALAREYEKAASIIEEQNSA